MAEKKTKTEEVEDGSSKHAIFGTPGSVAAPITAPEQSPPLELLVQDSPHPGRPFLLEAVQLARDPRGPTGSLWSSKAAALADRHKASLLAYLERINNAPLNQVRLKWTLVGFVRELLDRPSPYSLFGEGPNSEHSEQGAARLLINRLEGFMTKCSSPLRPGVGPLFSRMPPSETKPSKKSSVGGLSSSTPRGVGKTCESCKKQDQKVDPAVVRHIATILASLDVPKPLQDALQEFLDFSH